LKASAKKFVTEPAVHIEPERPASQATFEANPPSVTPGQVPVKKRIGILSSFGRPSFTGLPDAPFGPTSEAVELKPED
jgi:hypothetical protein